MQFPLQHPLLMTEGILLVLVGQACSHYCCRRGKKGARKFEIWEITGGNRGFPQDRLLSIQEDKVVPFLVALLALVDERRGHIWDEPSQVSHPNCGHFVPTKCSKNSWGPALCCRVGAENRAPTTKTILGVLSAGSHCGEVWSSSSRIKECQDKGVPG